MNKPCLFLLGMVTLVAACKKSGSNEMDREAAPANLHKVEAIANKYGFRYDSIYVSTAASNKSITAEKFETLLSGQSIYDHGDFPKVAVMTSPALVLSQPMPGSFSYAATGELTEFASRLLPNKYILYYTSTTYNGTKYTQCTNSEFYFVGVDVYTQWTYAHNGSSQVYIGDYVGANGTSTERVEVSGVSLTRLYSVVGTYRMNTNMLSVTMSKKN